jgi:hypothetical protein
MIVACGAFYAVVFLCIARQVLLADFFYRLNEKISRSVAIGCIDWLAVILFSILFLYILQSHFSE